MANFLSNLAAFGTGAMEGYERSEDRKLRQKQAKLMDEYRQLEMEQLKSKRETEQAAATGAVGALGGIFGGTPPAGGVQAQMQPGQSSRPMTTLPSMAGGLPIGFEANAGRTLGFEGGYSPMDSSGGPTKYGIAQTKNPDVNLASLTPQGAKQIYKQRYWDTIGGDILPPSVQGLAFDTSILMGPQRAKEFLAQSGGDPQKFMALRQNFENQLVRSNPQKYGPYLQGWRSRDEQIMRTLPQGGAPQQPQQPQQAPQQQGGWEQKYQGALTRILSDPNIPPVAKMAAVEQIQSTFKPLVDAQLRQALETGRQQRFEKGEEGKLERAQLQSGTRVAIEGMRNDLAKQRFQQVHDDHMMSLREKVTEFEATHDQKERALKMREARQAQQKLEAGLKNLLQSRSIMYQMKPAERDEAILLARKMIDESKDELARIDQPSIRRGAREPAAPPKEEKPAEPERIETFAGKKYRLRPGADETKKESWELVQ